MDNLVFEGAVVAVYLKSPSEYGAVLRNARLVTVGSRTFLTGTAIAPKTHWANNRRIYLAWDHVVYVTEYESEEDFHAKRRSRLRRWLAGSKKKRKRSFLRHV